MTGEFKPNIGIITAYNDMLSAHQPYETYPQIIVPLHVLLVPLRKLQEVYRHVWG